MEDHTSIDLVVGRLDDVRVSVDKMTSAIADLAVAQAAATEKASALEGRIASLETSRLWLIGAVAAAIIKALLALIIPT